MVVLDPQPHARRGLATSIERAAGMELVAAATHPSELPRGSLPAVDVVVIEPEPSCERPDSLFAAVRRDVPGARLVSLSILDDPDHARRFRRAGAVVAMSKGLRIADILETLRRVAEHPEDDGNGARTSPARGHGVATETKGDQAMNGITKDHVYKKIEVTGSSTEGIEDAVDQALQRASRTVRQMRWFEVVDLRGHIEDERPAHWQVTVKIGFTLDE